MKKAIQLISLALAVVAFTTVYAQDAAAPAATEDAPMGGEVSPTDVVPPAEQKSMMDEVKSAVENQVKAAGEEAAKASDAAATVGEEIKDEAIKAIDEVKDEAMKVAAEVKDETKTGVIAWIKDKVMMIINGIKDGFTHIWDSIMGLFAKKDAAAS